MVDSGVPFIRGTNLVDGKVVNYEMRYISFEKHRELKKGHLQAEDILFTNRGEIGKIAYVDKKFDGANLNSQIAWLRSNKERLLPKFLMGVLQSPFIQNGLQIAQNGATLQQFTIKQLKSLKIPLPPLSIQKEIVEKIEGFQRIIDGAKQVVENYKPQIDISPDWEMAELGEVVNFKTGKLNSNAQEKDGIYPFFTCSKEVFRINRYSFDCEALLLSGNNASGDFDVKHYKGKFDAYQRTYVITIKNETQLIYRYVRTFLESKLKELKTKSIGGLTRYLTLPMITSLQLPLPPLEVQQQIVARIEREQELVNANKELIKIFEQKIKDEIGKLWEEDVAPVDAVAREAISGL